MFWLASLQTLPPSINNDFTGHPTLAWQGADLKVLRGKVIYDRDSLQLTLDADGQALIQIVASAFPAADYPLIKIDAGGLSRLQQALFLWRTGTPQSPLFRSKQFSPGPTHQLPLPRESWNGYSLDMRDNEDWTGEIAQLAIALKGKPEQQITLETVALRPATGINLASALLADWGQSDSWDQWSINMYKGDVPGIAFGFRVAGVVIFLGGALATYFILLVVLRFRRGFDWRVAGGLLITGWFALDLPWQWSLWQQVGDTRDRYAGKNNQQKALSAPDASLYRLVEEIQPLLGEASARVFIATPFEYAGLRTAYHLYPHNPFWARNRPELPPARSFISGDFVLLLQSQQVSFNHEAGELTWSGNERIKAKPLYSSDTGRLYQVL